MYITCWHSITGCHTPKRRGRRLNLFSNEQVEINLPKDSGTWRAAQPKFRPFAVGVLVLRRILYYTQGERSKLSPRFDGPYWVMYGDTNGVTFRVRRLSDWKVIGESTCVPVKAVLWAARKNCGTPRDSKRGEIQGREQCATGGVTGIGYRLE